jgi:dTDP-4-dehydrorhamnose reductase
MKRKILIVGANGFAGRRVMNKLVADSNCVVTGCSLHPDILPCTGNYRFIESDITVHANIQRLFDEIRPDVVVNTSALSSPDYCDTHREEADAINIHAVEALARACEHQGSRFIHFSTDFVFAGDQHKLYTEDDMPSPVNYYGRTKMESERVVSSISSNYAIARVVIVYGMPFEGQHGNIATLVAKRLHNKEEIRVVNDQWRTPTFVGDVADGICRLINYTANGIYHICGGECMSISDFAFRVADALGLDRSLIIPVSTSEMNEKVARPHFSGLSIEKARRELDFNPCTIEEGVKGLRAVY